MSTSQWRCHRWSKGYDLGVEVAEGVIQILAFLFITSDFFLQMLGSKIARASEEFK